MADLSNGSGRDDGIEIIDLSAEAPTTRLGQPWQTEPAPEIAIRGVPAEMLTWMFCVAVMFALLRFGVELNRFVAFVLAFMTPWCYGGASRLGMTLELGWRNRGPRRGDGDPS